MKEKETRNEKGGFGKGLKVEGSENVRIRKGKILGEGGGRVTNRRGGCQKGR